MGKEMVLEGHPEGTRSLQTSRRGGDRISPVSDRLERCWMRGVGAWAASGWPLTLPIQISSKSFIELLLEEFGGV